MITTRNTQAVQLNRGLLTMTLMLWIGLLSHRLLIPLKICRPTSRKQELWNVMETSWRATPI